MNERIIPILKKEHSGLNSEGWFGKSIEVKLENIVLLSYLFF